MSDPITDRIVALDLQISSLATRLAERNDDTDELDDLQRVQVLVDLVDELKDWQVLAARDAGASWSDIGQAVGTSRQAAQARYGMLTWAKLRRLGATKWREPRLL